MLFRSEEFLTNGGRVLGVTAKGRDLKDAREKAYMSVKEITFDNKYYRKDIGEQILENRYRKEDRVK